MSTVSSPLRARFRAWTGSRPGRRCSPRCGRRAGSSPSSGLTCMPSATVTAAGRSWSRGSPCSGSSGSPRYFAWVDDMHDWCISRQLWWGHRIPVWYGPDGQTMCLGPGEEPPADDGWRQDPDVLDTWFSSALWPFSTLGWPDDTADLRAFYPTSVLVTGYDILFFW